MRPLIGLHTCPGLWACAPRAAGSLIRVHPHPGFQVWAPRPVIRYAPTRLQVYAEAAYPVFTVQGLRGWESKRPPLLWRIL